MNVIFRCSVEILQKFNFIWNCVCSKNLTQNSRIVQDIPLLYIDLVSYSRPKIHSILRCSRDSTESFFFLRLLTTSSIFLEQFLFKIRKQILILLNFSWTVGYKKIYFKNYGRYKNFQALITINITIYRDHRWDRSFDWITFFLNSSVVLTNCVLVEKWRSFKWRPRWSFLSKIVLSNSCLIVG